MTTKEKLKTLIDERAGRAVSNEEMGQRIQRWK